MITTTISTTDHCPSQTTVHHTPLSNSDHSPPHTTVHHTPHHRLLSTTDHCPPQTTVQGLGLHDVCSVQLPDQSWLPNPLHIRPSKIFLLKKNKTQKYSTLVTVCQLNDRIYGCPKETRLLMFGARNLQSLTWNPK